MLQIFLKIHRVNVKIRRLFQFFDFVLKFDNFPFELQIFILKFEHFILKCINLYLKFSIFLLKLRYRIRDFIRWWYYLLIHGVDLH